MFSLDQPILAPMPLAGGNGGFPPASVARPFAPASGANNGPKAIPKNNPVSVIPASYPKPRAWIDRRIALCERHHSRFLVWRAANIAKLAAWVRSQPGYDADAVIRSAYDSKIRNAYRAKHGRA